jgi:serine protease Do
MSFNSGGMQMQGIKLAALGGALVLAAGLAPTAQAQSRDSLVRAFEIGRGSRLGVTVHDIEDSDTKDTKQPRAGVVIDTVDPGGPADKAGIKSGDAVTEFDGERVRSARQFSRLVQETPSGRSVAVALSRGGQRLTVTVTPERSTFGDDFGLRLLETPRAIPPVPPSPPAAPVAPRAARPPAPAAPFEFFGMMNGRRLGITIETLDDQLAQYFGVKEGVLVKSVSRDSSAEKAGVKAGDVITSVNGRRVYEVSDVNRALDRMDDTDDYTLEIVRDKKAQTLKGKLESRTRGRSTATIF